MGQDERDSRFTGGKPSTALLERSARVEGFGVDGSDAQANELLDVLRRQRQVRRDEYDVVDDVAVQPHLCGDQTGVTDEYIAEAFIAGP